MRAVGPAVSFVPTTEKQFGGRSGRSAYDIESSVLSRIGAAEGLTTKEQERAVKEVVRGVVMKLSRER